RAVGPGVEIVRAASYDEVRARLDAADVAVSPRTERSGFPMKLLNYMAAGKAIVASAGSAKGLRDGVSGRVVPDGDEGAFAAAVGTRGCSSGRWTPPASACRSGPSRSRPRPRAARA